MKTTRFFESFFNEIFLHKIWSSVHQRVCLWNSTLHHRTESLQTEMSAGHLSASVFLPKVKNAKLMFYWDTDPPYGQTINNLRR